MPEPRQINPVTLDIGQDSTAVDFTPRAVSVPKDSSALAFVDNSPSAASQLPVQSEPPSNSEDSISTPPSSPPSDVSPSSESAETPETNAPVEKAPTPTETSSTENPGPLTIVPSPNPVPFPKDNVVAPPPVS